MLGAATACHSLRGRESQADVARHLGFNRAMITQLVDLALLAPDIQEEIFGLESVDRVEPVTERAVRRVARARHWENQRARQRGRMPH